MTRSSKSFEKIVLDLETKKGFHEIEGRNCSLLGVSVVGIFSYAENQFKTFLEKDIPKLIPYLKRAQLVIGFNIKRFDFPVLAPYLDFALEELNCLDIFEEVQNRLGFRLGLNSIAQATLKLGKIGSGLEALKYFRQGEIDKLIQYCQQDVFVTRELYVYGQRHGHLLYFRDRRLETIPVSWAECKTVDALVREAFNQRMRLEIEYASNDSSLRTIRQIDIYNFELGRIIAFCHLRKQLRTFNIRRILSARITQGKYDIPADFNQR
jgi:DEAD/DEAH box helicase domain-containing protein